MKKIKIIIAVFLIVGLIVLIVDRFMYLFGAEKITSFESFTDICAIKNCSEKEQENIENMLKTMIVETDDVLYFDANKDNYNVYKLVGSCEIASLLGYDDILDSNKKKIASLDENEIKKYDFLNILYYLEACKDCDFQYNESIIFDIIKKHYDKDKHLYFNNTEDSIIQRLNTNAILYDLLGDKLPYTEDIKLELKQIYDNYEFKTVNESFYNSGGALLNCLHVFNCSEYVKLNDIKEWCNYWSDYYSHFEVKTNFQQLEYFSYVGVAKKYGFEFKLDKSNDYYKTYKPSEINDKSDLYMIAAELEYVESYDNEDFNNELKKLCTVEVDNRIKYDLQTVRNTFYGYNIATALKIDFDNKKYDAYMYEVSKKIASLDDIHERVDYLYYYSMYVYYKNLKQGQPIHISENDKKIVEKTIDKVIAQIKKNNMNADDLIMLERTLEIFSTFAPENEITLSRIEVYYIKKYLKKILKEKNMVESPYFMYVYHSAHLLNSDIIAQSDIELAKTSFMENINKSDLVTISQYFDRCCMIFNDEQVSEIKKNLMDLRSKNAVMPGITGYGIMDGILYYDLQSIGYGNNEM